MCRVKPRILDHNLLRGAAPMQPSARRRSLRPSFGEATTARAGKGMHLELFLTDIYAPAAPRGEGHVHVLMVRTRRAHARSDAIHWVKTEKSARAAQPRFRKFWPQ